MKTYVFHGSSGSGKDTQIDKLEEKFPGRFVRIGTGEMFRLLAKLDDPLAEIAEEYYEKGKLVPDVIVYKLLDMWLQLYDSEKDWIFVSPVRNETQIKLFDQLLKKWGRELDRFVHFKLDVDTAIERMSLRTYCPACDTTYHSKYKPAKKEGVCDFDGGKLIRREDDEPEAIKNRIAFYQDSIESILKEYRRRGILIEIDAAPSIDEIHKEVLNKLGLSTEKV